MIIAINDSPETVQNVSNLLSNLEIQIKRGFVILGSELTVSDVAISDPKKSFYAKIIDKLFSKINKKLFEETNSQIQNEEKNSQTQNFISQLKPFIETTEKITYLFNNLHIQINGNSQFIQQKKESYLEKKIKIDHKYDHYILKSFDSGAGHIFTNYGVMVLGVDVLSDFAQEYQKKYSQEELLGFVYFHELSHQLDKDVKDKPYQQNPVFFDDTHNHFNNPWNDNVFYRLVMTRLELFSFPNIANNFNELLKKSPFQNEFSPVDQKILENLNTLHKEFYADVGGILFLRNYLLEKNPQFTNQEIKERIQSLIEMREHEAYKNIQSTKNKKSSQSEKENNLFNSIDHLTSRGFENLLSRLDAIPQRQLSLQEISSIARICTNHAMLEQVYLLSQTCPQFQSTLKTLSILNFDPKSGNIIYKPSDENTYDYFYTFIKNHSDPQWNEQIQNQLQIASNFSSMQMEEKFSLGFPSLAKKIIPNFSQKIQEYDVMQNSYFHSQIGFINTTYYKKDISPIESFLTSAMSESSFDSVLTDSCYSSLLFPVENIFNNHKLSLIQQTFADDSQFQHLSLHNLDTVIQLHRSIYIEIESIQKLFKTKLYSLEEMSALLDSNNLPENSKSLLSHSQISNIYSTIQSQIQKHQGVDFNWDKITEYYYVQSLSQFIKKQPNLAKDLSAILSIEYNTETGLPQKKESSFPMLMDSFEKILQQPIDCHETSQTSTNSIENDLLPQQKSLFETQEISSIVSSIKNQRNYYLQKQHQEKEFKL